MSLFRRFSVVVVAFVLAGMSPALAQDIPDDATRAHVAEWLDQCSRNASDACMPVIKRIEDSPMFGYCQAIEWSWDAARLVWDPENAHFVDEAVGRREKAREFIAKCVPIYAAALRETDDRDDSSGDTAYRGPVEAADRVMQAVKRSNLRSGPGTTYGKVGLLDIGDEVLVTGVVGGWLRIAAPDGGEAFIYGPLLAEVTPDDQGTAAVERETEPTASTVAVTEPACTPELPEGSGCWQELTERPGCHIWIPYLAYSVVYTTWSGGCADGKAEGEGLLGKTMGEHFHTESPATFAAGYVTEMGQFVVVDGPSEQARPVSEESGTDTPSVDVTSGSGPLHGSIAFSQEDGGGYAWGIAWSFDSSAGAQAEAIGQCREYGGTQCAEAGWFQEACGALAIGSGNGSGTGWGATTAEAERDALRQCRERLNDDCRIEVARCSQSEEAGGSGRTDDDVDAVVGRDPADAPPSDNSGQACDAWEASYTVTWTEEGLQRGGINLTEVEAGFLTKAEAEDFVQSICSSRHSQYGPGAGVDYVLESCTVGEATCVQPSAPQEAPAHVDHEPADAQPSDNSEQVCRWFAYVWYHVPAGPDAGSYAISGGDTTETGAIDYAMSTCQSWASSGTGSCAFADSCLACQPAEQPSLWDPPCDPDPE